MSTPILATKLHIPRPRPKTVSRPRLIEQLNQGLQRKLTLISAPAGFGKTTLLSDWIPGCNQPVAWLSLDEGDNDAARFVTYIIAALQTIARNVGKGVLPALQSPQRPPVRSILTALLNEIALIENDLVLVLDDYHAIDAKPIDDAVAFLLEHLPPHMHFVIATREDPDLPLARLRARGELNELRVSELRFTTSEAAGFLNETMGLSLSLDDVAALESRTEGWIAGLQLAAISMQGQDTTRFINSFAGSHHFVMDYLIEEVLQRQPESVQRFLLCTSILDRMCGPLCDALFHCSPGSGQKTLAYLEHANLFIVPLDNERRWYRYHHLFRDLLRQRLQQSAADGRDDALPPAEELHRRASGWYEHSGLELEAFHHAAAANDFESAERLIEGNGMPLHFRGAVAPVLNWLSSLPESVLDAWPSLWTSYASVLLVTGHTTIVEQKLQAAEAGLEQAQSDDKTRDLIGRIAAIRATAAVNQNQVETIIAQSRRALEYLNPRNQAFRTSTIWKLGYAYHLRGDRAAAKAAYTEVASIGKASGNVVFALMATIGLGSLQEGNNQLGRAEQTYRSVVQMCGDQPLPFASEAHLGLARILYERNDLEAAREHARKSLELLGLIENTDRVVASEVFLGRIKLATGDARGAAAILTRTAQFARENNFLHRLPEIVGAQVLTLLRDANVNAARQLADKHQLPISQARVELAGGSASNALSVLESLRRQAEEKCWEDERLKVMVLQSLAHDAAGNRREALQLAGEALALAEPAGFIRLFVDEGPRMARLLSEAAGCGMRDYVVKLLAAFEAEELKVRRAVLQPLVEPLSRRELEVLRLIAKGLSNREISERLFLAVSSVKGHNLRIFGKLQVQRRTEAVARARELGLL